MDPLSDFLEQTLMDCREFRNKHVGFVDDLLPAFDMDAMQRHLYTCANCSRHDTKIRRSLLIVRNLPPIEPSPEFVSRLNARLAELGPESRRDIVSRSPLASYASYASFAALAAGIAAVAYLAVETNNYFSTGDELRLGAASAVAVAAPVVEPAHEAYQPVRSAEPINTAALVASVPTGMPVFPTVLMMGQSPMHLASLQFPDEGR